MDILRDAAAERAVLSAIAKFGVDAYFDVCDIISSRSFYEDINQRLYEVFKHILENDNNAKIDIPLVFSAGRELQISHLLEKKSNVQHIQAVFDFPATLSNARKFAAKIRKLEIAKLLINQLEDCKGKIYNVSGNESVGHIIGIAEDGLLTFTNSLDDDHAFHKIAEGLYDKLIQRGENPVEQVGLSSGYSCYDSMIGGGLRVGTVNIVGARTGIGKSIFVSNVIKHVSKDLGIPSLYLDTELVIDDQQNRLLALLSETSIGDIETGKYYQSIIKREKVLNAAKSIQDMPYTHVSIAGMPQEDQISVIRRWLMKEVGLVNGKAKPCLVVYDYIKLMSADGLSSDLKEYQLLGFLLTCLHNMTVRYGFPILATIQLTRDGLTKMDTSVASGSDRIVWLCSNFSIFKPKSDEEIAEDLIKNGTHKLVVLKARHGAGTAEKDYINYKMDGWCARITEGLTKFELEQKKREKAQGFTHDIVNEEIPY